MLQHLYLGSNKLSSTFSLSVWNISGLLYLDVSQNSTEGLKAIVELHFPYNYLEKLSSLKSTNVSFNGLEGVIPSGSVFSNFTLQ